MSSILSFLAVKLEYIPSYPLNTEQEQKKLFNKLFFFSFLYILNIAFGNISLKIVNLALSQVVRSVIPFVAMFLSYLILGSTFSFRLILSVIPLCLGVGLTVYKNQEFDLAAIIVLGVGIVLAALKGVITSKYLSEYNSMHPVEFLMRICPLSFILLVVLSTVQGETSRIMEKYYLEQLTPMAWICAFMTGFFAFVLNWTNFIVTRATSPLTVSVAGNIKQVITVLLGIYLFSIPISWLNGIGILISIFGLVFYSHTKLIEQEKKKVIQILDKIEVSTNEKS